MTDSGQQANVLNNCDGLVVCMLSEKEFSQCRQPWNDLLDASLSESFFMKWEWIYTFWSTIDKQDVSLLVCFCYDNTQLVGIAPLYSYKCTFFGLPVNKVAFLGDRVASDYQDIIARPGYEEACCGAVVGTFIKADHSAEYSLLEFDGVCADSNIYRHLTKRYDSANKAIVLPRFECPRACVAGGLEEYINSLSASSRYYLRRKQRKIESSFESIEVRNVDLSGNPELVEVLFDLHAKRWGMLKDRESTFNSDFRKKFNNELLKCLAGGEGFFSCVMIEDKPVSIMYIFMYKGNAYFYQNGWDPVYAPYSIGIYNILRAIEFSIENGCKTFDFLRGPEAYKYTFSNDVRQAYAVLQFRPGMTGNFLKVLLHLKIGLKNILNRCGLPGNRKT